MNESEDNMADGIKMENSTSAVKVKPKKRSLVERELETTLTARVTSPATSDGSSTSRYGRARRHKTDSDFYDTEKAVTKALKSPQMQITPVKSPLSAYKMHASNSAVHTESPKRILSLEGTLENQIENIYNANISLSRFGSDEKKNVSPSPVKKFPKVYIRKDLIQTKEKEETVTLIKNMFSPQKSARKTNSHLSNVLERSSEKFNLNGTYSKPQNGYLDNLSVVKTLDFDGNKKKKRNSTEIKSNLSKNELFELEAKCMYQVGDLVWARMGTFPFWPSIITREPGSEMFVRKKMFGKVERDIIHVTFFGDNGRRSWVLDSMLRRYQGLAEFEAARDAFTPEAKRKDPRLHNAFFISQKKLALWHMSIEETETLQREPKRFRIDILNQMLGNTKSKVTPKAQKSGKITRTDSDVSLSESLYDSLFSEDDVKNDDADRSRNKTRNKSLDVSEVVTACLDNMAARTGITMIQKQSHMDIWLQKAKSQTPEKSQLNITVTMERLDSEKPKPKEKECNPSAKKKKRDFTKVPTQKPYSLRKSTTESQNLLSHHNEHDYSKTAISENNEQNDNTIETDNHICVIDKVVSLSNAAINNNNEDSQVITENNENIDKNVDDCSNNIYNFEIDQAPESPTFTQVFDEEIQVSHEQNFNKDNNLTNITETFEVSVEKVTETNEKNEKSDELTLTETEHVSSSDINFQLGSEKKVKNIDDNMIPEILSSTEEISRNKETVADIPETNENKTSEIVQIPPLSNENLPCTKKKTKSVFLDKTVECDSIAIEENTTIEQDQTTSKQSFPDNQKSANLEEITGDISNVDNNMSVDEIIDSPHEVTSNDQEIIVANTNILPEEETSIDKTENNTKMLDNEPISEKTSVNDGQEMAANGVIDDKDDLSNLTISKVKDIDQLSDDLFDEDDIDDNRDISMIDEENLLKDDPTDKSVTEKTDDKDRGQETNLEIENTVTSKNIDVESNFNEPVINDNVCDSIDDVSVLENGHTEQTDKNTEATSTEVDTADNISLNSVSLKEISFEPDTLSIDSLSSDLSEPCLPQITEVVSISEKDISSSTDDDIRPGRSKRTMILDSDNESMSSLDEITLSELQRRTRSKSLQMATQHTENSIDSVKSDKSESRKLRVVLKDCLLIKDNKLPAIKQISSNTNAEIEISETQLDIPLKARKLRLRRSLPPPKIVKPAETETIPNPKETETTVNHVKTEPPDEAAEITKPIETVTPEKPIKTEETVESETYSKSVEVKQVATSAETEIPVKSEKTVTVNGFHDSKELSPDRTIKEPEPDTVSINSSDSGASIKRRGKKTRTDSEKMRDPEFLKYVELRQDALMDDHPELTQEEIIAYLFKTWEYEENRKSDFKKNDDIEQSNLVKGTSTSNEPLRKKKVIRPKKVIDIAKVMKDVNVKTTNKNNIVAVEDVKPRELPKRKSVQPFYKEDYSDIEDEIELFEIFKPKKKDSIKSEPKEKDAQNDTIKIKTEDQAVKVKTEVPKVDSNTDDAKDTKEEIEISDQEEEFEEYYDEAEAYFEQLTKPKPNVFKGLLREKVCEICEETSNLVKCKGCNGMFHIECVNKVEEIIEVPAPTRGRKKKVKKPRGRRPKVSTESNGDESYSDEKQDANVSTEDVSFEEVKEPKPIIISDADDFEAQIAEKMKEMIEIDTIQYDSYSSDDGIDWSETVAGKCEIVDIKIKPKIEPVDYSDFKCKNCQKNDVPICFVCKSDVSPKGKIERRQKCQVAHCHKYYHLECLDHWPQTQFTSGEPSRNNKKIDEHFEAITCPRHVCHTCVCDDPRGCKTRFSGDKLARCVRCPATYHSFTKCLPAGSQILSASHIVCPRHHEHRPGKVPCHVNTGWCFICALGGTLICCEYCPTSFHADCLNIEPPEGGYMCEDCETGRLPLYGEMVWVKLGHYRWWPGIILHPSEIPDNIMAVKHSPGEFVVRFFGQYDHYWVNRGRVFPFQEGDSGRISGQKSKIDEDFTIAMEHAKRAFEILKNVEPNDEENQDIASSLLPPHYVKLKVNRPCGALYGKKVDLEESSLTQCECSPDEEEPCGPYSHCLNRMLLTECGPICRAGDRCQNRAFEKRLYPKLVPYRTPHRGWGLKTLEDVKAGQFVIEYVGELIDEEEFRRRMRRMHEMRDENFYFLTLDKERMIDAGPKGNLARFMNHCCEPNCETQKWTVLGDIRVGLFAIHDIPANTEVTFNYNLECTGIEKKQCMCGAKRCSGYIGEKPKQDEPQSKKPKIPAKRTYKKRKTIESPSTSKNGPKRPVGRPPKPRELTDIEKDLLIIKNATNGISSDSESERLSVESERKDPKALKRKRVSFSTEDKIFVYNGTSSPSVKRMKLDNEVGD